jgi:hypothetical protein
MMRIGNCKLQIANCKFKIARCAISVGRTSESVLVVACLLLLACGKTAPAAPFSFDDIVLWYGTGTNRAALAIDWIDSAAEPQALVWGFRWDGTATGANMLTAIAAGDPRLFARLGGSPGNPTAVYGLGYDADGDREFAIDDGTTFDANGLAYSGPADGAIATDAADYYAEGWFTGFWHYGVAASNPYDGGSWADIGSGMASRALVDGAWDSWTFTPTFNFAAFAQNPTAALPYSGDFNADGNVDGLDYSAWRSAFGATSQPMIDASRNGTVDAADYVVWRKNVGSTAGRHMQNTPEPTTAFLVAMACLVSGFVVRRRTLINANCR